MIQGRTSTAALLGGLLGAVLGIGALALAAARTIDTGLTLAPQPRGGALFEVGRPSMTLLILLAGAVGGFIIGAIGYAVGRSADPTERRYRAAPLIALGAGTGAIIAFAASRAAIGAAATSIVDNVVTISAFRASLVAVVTGAVTGLVVATTVERMARPALFQFGGEAWPAHLGAFIRDSATAILIPVVGLVAAAAIVFGLSRALLEWSHLVALVIFAGTAAAVLFGAAAIAARQPKRDD
jgi:hypothetical protein